MENNELNKKSGSIQSFLTKYKYYILIPFVVLLLFYILVMFLTQDENVSPFVYSIL